MKKLFSLIFLMTAIIGYAQPNQPKSLTFKASATAGPGAIYQPNDTLIATLSSANRLLGFIPLSDLSSRVGSTFANKNEIQNRLNTDYQNLFDKNNDAIDNFGLNTDGTVTANALRAVSKPISILPNKKIWIMKNWSAMPFAYAFYDINNAFISYSEVPQLINPGGFVTTSPSNAYYIRFNLKSEINPNLSQNINNFMIYFGDYILSDYKSYQLYSVKGSDVEIPLWYNYNKNRYNSYSNATNVIPEDSRIDWFSNITSDKVGRWGVRKDRGTSVSKIDGGVRIVTTGAGENGGIMYQQFFSTLDIGKTIWIEFEARLISGSNSWNIAANSNASTAIYNYALTSEWVKYGNKVVVGIDQYADQRLLLHQLGFSASTIEVRNFKLYFTDPSVYSYPKVYNTFLSNFSNKADRIKNGENVSLVVGLYGDSWTQSVPSSIHYAKTLSRILRSTYGNGGGGFYDFSRSGTTDFMMSVDDADATDVRTGTITYKDQTADSKGVNIAHAEFANASTITLNVLTPHKTFLIHYFGGASYGSFRYRIDGGTWTTINTSSVTGYQTATIASTDATHVINFEVTAGTCILFGVDMQRDFGIRVHKLGNRGLRAYNFETIDIANWRNGLSKFNLDAMTVLLGTNDRTDDRTPFQLQKNLDYILSNALTAKPTLDLALISPSNNQQSEPYDMVEYGVKQYDLSVSKNIGFVDLIPLFGSTSKIIIEGTFFDVVHPTEKAGDMIADFLYKNLFSVSSQLGQGWAQYNDTSYTSGSPFTVTSGTTSTLPNNAGNNITTQLPAGVSWYNSSTNKITPSTDGDYYVTTIRFKAMTTAPTAGYFDFGIDIGGALGIQFKETKIFAKGAGIEHNFSITVPMYSATTFVANGGLVKITSGNGNMTIYDISYQIDRTYKAR